MKGKKPTDGAVAFVSSNGMINIPVRLKREMGITRETPLLIEREDKDSIRITKVMLVKDSVAAQMWKKYPAIAAKSAVRNIRKIRSGFYEAGEQWD